MQTTKTTIIVALSALTAPLLDAQTLFEDFTRDQGYEFLSAGTATGTTNGNMLWQSFTVGIEGTLEGIELQLSSFSFAPPIADDLQFWLLDMDSLHYYATQHIPLSSIPASNGLYGGSMVSVYLETPVALKAGSQYKLAIQSDGATLSNAIYWFRGGNLYEGGDSSIGSGVDFGFYTYMTPGAVLDDPSPLGAIPEPSTYALIFGIGAMGLIGWRRIRR